MRIQTFSIIAGSAACNARCPFCVSKMTPPHGVILQEPEVNWRNFRKACLLARQSETTTAMFTGKGEPTLFPEQITKYLAVLKEFDFPLIELQSNGIPLAEQPETYCRHLQAWYESGLNTIAISIVHYDPEMNRKIYLPYRKEYIDLPKLIQSLHSQGFSVRLACILAHGFIGDPDGLQQLISFAGENGVEQLTVRPVSKPANSKSHVAEDWAEAHHLPDGRVEQIREYLISRGTLLMRLLHGAEVYDVDGQNVCLSDCLTLSETDQEIRQLIFFPDGHLRYDWQYGGAILL